MTVRYRVEGEALALHDTLTPALDLAWRRLRGREDEGVVLYRTRENDVSEELPLLQLFGKHRITIMHDHELLARKYLEERMREDFDWDWYAYHPDGTKQLHVFDFRELYAEPFGFLREGSVLTLLLGEPAAFRAEADRLANLWKKAGAVYDRDEERRADPEESKFIYPQYDRLDTYRVGFCTWHPVY